MPESLKFIAVYQCNDDRTFTGRVEQFPSVTATDYTPEATRARLKETLALAIAAHRDLVHEWVRHKRWHREIIEVEITKDFD